MSDRRIFPDWRGSSEICGCFDEGGEFGRFMLFSAWIMAAGGWRLEAGAVEQWSSRALAGSHTKLEVLNDGTAVRSL